MKNVDYDSISLDDLKDVRDKIRITIRRNSIKNNKRFIKMRSFDPALLKANDRLTDELQRVIIEISKREDVKLDLEALR